MQRPFLQKYLESDGLVGSDEDSDTKVVASDNLRQTAILKNDFISTYTFSFRKPERADTMSYANNIPSINKYYIIICIISSSLQAPYYQGIRLID